MKAFINVDTQPVGMYVTEGRVLDKTPMGKSGHWLCRKDFPYLPIFNWIQITPDNQVVLSSTSSEISNIDNSHCGYNLTKYTEDVMKKSKIDISSNDLLMGPVNLMFNFTGVSLTITSHSGIPKSYAPLTLTSLPDLSGKLVLVTIHTLNTTRSMSHAYGYNNVYLKDLREKLAGKQDPVSVELKSIYDYVLSCLDLGKGMYEKISSDTYKVATMSVIDANEVFRVNKAETFSVNNKRIEVSREHILNAPLHEVFSEDYMHDRKIMSSIREHGVSCFIVDNSSLIGERYINYAGTVRNVPRVTDSYKQNGFYLLSVDASKVMEPEVFVPIGEIDKLEYIFKTHEEALVGANLKAQYADKLESLKMTQNLDSFNAKSEYEKQLRELDLEAKRNALQFEEIRAKNQLELEAQKADMTRQELQRKLDYEALVTQLKVENEKRKQDTETHKFSYDQTRHHMDSSSLYMKKEYEQGKYERDSTIETIKTVGAVAGLVAGGYVLFKKFS